MAGLCPLLALPSAGEVAWSAQPGTACQSLCLCLPLRYLLWLIWAVATKQLCFFSGSDHRRADRTWERFSCPFTYQKQKAGHNKHNIAGLLLHAGHIQRAQLSCGHQGNLINNLKHIRHSRQLL